ncbi:hypothetical protein Scani_80280 [Streptomyces caniferus]|uniref:Uncharacterized protein n=1 Tax=Streptomyces caniferus TaxID=285557 RepID=A0A640SL89_9ACTN|nr:hypothetical protein Scani_80280 [Streptomyces caniferus]
MTDFLAVPVEASAWASGMEPIAASVIPVTTVARMSLLVFMTVASLDNHSPAVDGQFSRGKRRSAAMLT